MIQNFFLTAWRTILRNRSYSIINFVGLTGGVALALLILSYVRSEFSFDRFHEKADRLYRIRYVAPNGLELASSPPPIAPLMRDFFPEVEAAARVYGRNVSIKRVNQEIAFEETNVYFADSTLMDLMTFEFVQGNPARALRDEFTVIINEEMAQKYFGEANPIGETLVFGGRHSFKVVAVVKDFPETSHLRFNMLVPYENMFDMEDDATAELLRNNLAINFIISHSYTYVLLKPGSNPLNVDQKMEAFLLKYARPERRVGQVFTLVPITDIHLHSTMLAEPTATNSMTNLYIFMGVGLITILIACINYINLSTAQSLTRIKEIGLRKVLGSGRGQIILQFLAESFLFCSASMLFSWVVFSFTLPLLNQLTGKELEFANEVNGFMVGASVLLLFVITLLAGAYPSYFVAQFNSIGALKREAGIASGSQWLRKSLVVFQLMTACVLLSGSFFIIRQLDFLGDRPLGFYKDHIINIPLSSQNLNSIFASRDSLFRTRLQSFRDGIEQETGVLHTTLSSGAPGLGVVFRGTIPDGFSSEDRMFVANFAVDFDFRKTYEMEMAAGRFFDRQYGTDETEAFVINERAVREFKWGTPEDALGKSINREGKIGKVIGVVKDFNFASLTTEVSALVMEVDPDQFNTLSIRFENNNVQSTLDRVALQWNRLFPEKSFEFSFLDQQLNLQYSNFRDFGTIIQAFTGIGMLISCLGVYGLILFVVQRKVKEIGVRKVLGATVQQIVVLLYKDFAFLILLGFVVAVPVASYLTSQWLDNFVYRIELDALTFAAAFLCVVVITTLTISYQAVRASLANPVVSLRSE